MQNIFWMTYGVLAVLCGCIAGYGIVTFDEPQLIQISREHSLVEFTTPILFFIAGVFLFCYYLMHRNLLDLAGCYAMVLAGVREMDWHKAFTQDSILKLRFYLDPSMPFFEKIIGGIIVFILVLSAIYLLSKSKFFIRNLLIGSVSAWGIFVALVCLTVAKMMDSMGRLFPFLLDFKNQNLGALMYVEELLELFGAAYFVCVALILVIQGRIDSNKIKRSDV